MKLLKSIIIDTNTEVVKQLLNFAEENPILIAICAQVEHLKDAIELINEYQPDLVFLNPTDENLNSFYLLKEVDNPLPKFICISDDKKKAYDAFQCNAIDFLLDDLQPNALMVSLYKVIQSIEMETNFQNFSSNQKRNFQFQNTNSGILTITSTDKIDLIKINDILYCKADGKYTQFILENKKEVLSSKNLGVYQDALLQHHFFRIHHSYIINVKKIVKITKKSGLYCELSHGVLIPVAKRRQEAFLKYLK